MSQSRDELASIISDGARGLEIPLSPNAILSFQKYYELLETRGRSVNLTTVVGASDVARLHFLDSMALLNVVSFVDTKVIDIGSGAGFPGVPLKITEQTIDLTLLDSSGKRISFLSELCEAIGLDASCVQARAEEFAHEAVNRESFNIAVSRAVARLNVLSELCLPFVRIGGVFIAMKSVDSDAELSEACRAIETLGGELDKCIDYTIPDTEITHRVVVIKKVSNTPPKYPRRFARIQKSPL